MAERMPEGDWRNFALLWLGQVVSMLGSGLTGFGLGVWVFERTSSVADFTLIFVFGALPGLFLGPLVGALVDRWDRRWVMILADLGAVLATVALVIQLVRGQLELWQIYVIVAVGASCMTLQNPAFAATVPLLIPKKHLGRASGMMQLGPAASRILAPLLAGALMPILHLQGLIAIDVATFLFAAVTLLLIRLPQVPRAAVPAGAGRPRLVREALVGLTYIKERPGLVSLLLFFAVLNLLFASSMVLTTPLVLSFAGPPQLGIVLAVASAGMLAGSIVMSVWGGPRRKMLGILGFAPLLGASFLIIAARPSVQLVALGTFALFFVVPIINGCDQAIWQTKVERGVLGRVFAMAQLISQFTAPVAYLAAGPLSDRLEPMMRPGGALAGGLGSWIGVGPGRGIALLYLVMGILLIGAALAGFAYPRLRSLEDELPDAMPDAEPQPGTAEGVLPQPAAAEA
ncbi:MAG TPA: MFS transporter [Thermoanaerobaculia bacterium]|nr:MFS transporter [Thermoanaerobaculia bacterium]